MKYFVFIFIAFFACFNICEARGVIGNAFVEYMDKKPDLPALVQQVQTAVDTALNVARPLIKAKFDPYKTEDLKVGASFLTVSFTNGMLVGLSNPLTSEKLSISYKNRVFDITVPITFTKLKFTCTYKAPFLNGKLNGVYDVLKLKLELHIDFNKKTYSASIKVLDSGKLSLDFVAKNTAIENLIGKVGNNMIRKEIIKRSGEAAEKYLRDELKKHDSMISNALF